MRYKRVLSAFIALTFMIFAFSGLNAGAADKEFNDVPRQHWAYDSIMYLSELGAVGGYEDGSYRPDAAVTRGEWAKMLCATLGFQPVTGIRLYAELMRSGDLTADDWSAPYIIAMNSYFAYYRGSDGLDYYLPDDGAARETVAASIVRALGYTVSKGDYPNLAGFSDAEDISDTDKPYVDAAIADGIISGYDDGTIRPDAAVTRAEAACLLQRLISRAVGMSKRKSVDYVNYENRTTEPMPL
ncbi:MAG: S-layer homology domain-containing protein [Candidatus Ornithomonoglobus sp.]